MASLVGFAILAIAAAVVIPDLLRASRASSSVAGTSASPSILPAGVNDANLQNLQASIDRLAIIVGSGVGGGVAGAAGATVSGGQVGVARGLGANPISPEETKQLAENASSSGAAGGVLPSTDLFSMVGGFIGASGPSFSSGLNEAGQATSDLPNVPIRDAYVYDVPVLGAFYRFSDNITGRKVAQ